MWLPYGIARLYIYVDSFMHAPVKGGPSVEEILATMDTQPYPPHDEACLNVFV